MTDPGSVSFKTIHFIGDSHALAFKAKSIYLSEYSMVAMASVCYVRGLTALNIVNDRSLNPAIANYFLQQNLITKEGNCAALSEHAGFLAEQYATGKGFENPVVVFFAGEIYVRKLLGSMRDSSALESETIRARLLEVARKYVSDIKAMRDSFGFLAVIHGLNPPTGDDKTFERINNFHCPRELRVDLYKNFNEALRLAASPAGIGFVAADLADETGALNGDWEFDGVHADPIFASDVLKSAVELWLSRRGAEQSLRYVRWAELVRTPQAAPIVTQPVSIMGTVFDKSAVAALLGSIGTFEVALCKKPIPDWAHMPLRKGRKYNEVVKYASISREGLKTLYDNLIVGKIGDAIRACVGANFSLINCRAVQSLPHSDQGVGQQFLHRDGCPPGIFRGLIYLVDVNEHNGPFEYLPNDSSIAPIKISSEAGSLIIFDANAVSHRAAPPRNGIRLAIDLILLLHPPACAPIAHSYHLCTWPVDPYLFELVGESYPVPRKRRWFHPALVMPPKTMFAIKELTAAELAVGGA